MIATEDTGTTNFKPQIKVSSLTVEAGGFLTETGTPTSVYELPASDTSVAVIGSVALALDANGQADLVMRTEGNAGNEVLDFARSSTGAWSGPSSLSAGLYEAEHASGMQVAVAPGGRALLAFQTENFPARYSNVADTAKVYESLREPGGTFSTPTSVASASGVGGASATTRVAAGADGTLALATRTEACQTENHTEVAAEAITALIAAPGRSPSCSRGRRAPRHPRRRETPGRTRHRRCRGPIRRRERWPLLSAFAATSFRICSCYSPHLHASSPRLSRQSC